MKPLRIAALVLTGFSALHAQTSQPAATIDSLRWLVGGEWRAEGKWANGNAFNSKARFELALGGKYLQSTSSTFDDAGAEKPRDLVIFAEQEGKLIQHVFNADGNTRQATGSIDVNGDYLFEWTRPNKDGTATPVKQIITRLGDNECRQKFMMQLKGEWHTLLDVVWKRGG